MSLSQQQRLIKHFQDGNSITSLEAYNKLGITQLATRISEIEARDMKITRQRIKVTNRYGESCSVVQYGLEEKEAVS